MPATCDLTEPLCHMTTWTWDYLNTNFANILKSCKFESVVNEKVLIIWSLWTFFFQCVSLRNLLHRLWHRPAARSQVAFVFVRLLLRTSVLNSSLSSEDLSALCAPLRPRAWKPQGRWNTQRHRGSGGGGHSSTETVYGTTQTASQTRPCQNTDSEYLSHHQRCVCVCVHMQMCALVPWERESAAHSSLSLFLTSAVVVEWGSVCLVLCLALGTPIISFCLFSPAISVRE